MRKKVDEEEGQQGQRSMRRKVDNEEG